MKTQLFIAATALFCGLATNVNAQDAGKFRVGVGVGMNINSISKSQLDSKIGFNVGVKGDYFFTDNVYLGTGLFFNQKGAKKSILGFDVKETWNYLEIPVHVGYRHAFSDKVAIFGEFGPYFGYAVSAKQKFGDTSKSIFDGYFDEEDNKFVTDDNEYGAKRFEAGLGIHAGVEVSKFQFRIGYDFELTNHYKKSTDWLGSSYKQKHGTFTIGAAYFF